MHKATSSTDISLHEERGAEQVDAMSMAHLMNDDEATLQSQDMITSPRTPVEYSPLGKPRRKKRLHAMDIIAASISLISLFIAIMTVADARISWYLGTGNRQLIVIGFLLSVMNLCLGTVTPMFFLLLEARFGSSALQNYDAILLNRPLASRLNIVWRVMLGFMLALPIGLSVIYKTFIGGESALKVDSMDYISNTSYYGIFPPPSLLSFPMGIGIPVYFNATLPFLLASLDNSSLPKYPQVYGYNILSLSNESTAMLDIPYPQYLTAIQELLANGESWKISANVSATVATLNHSKTEDAVAFNSTFTSACESTRGEGDNPYSWFLQASDMYNYWNLVLMDQASLSNQSQQYIGLAPSDITSCSDFVEYVQLYDLTRQSCQGTWSITRAGLQLADGSCNGTVLPLSMQTMITVQEEVGTWYQSALIETLGQFSGNGSFNDLALGNQSAWMAPAFTTSMAAMMWSRVSALDSPAHFKESDFNISDWTLGTKNLYPGILYPVNHTVVYIRPTLQKSGLLYLTLAVQPLLIAIILLLTALLHYTPVDKGFGLVSILSGVDRQSLDVLAGATLSGDLTKPVKLDIYPTKNNQGGVIEYRIEESSTARVRRRKLIPDMIYH